MEKKAHGLFYMTLMSCSYAISAHNLDTCPHKIDRVANKCREFLYTKQMQRNMNDPFMVQKMIQSYTVSIFI